MSSIKEFVRLCVVVFLSIEASVGRCRLSRMSRNKCGDITLAKLEDEGRYRGSVVQP